MILLHQGGQSVKSV